MRPLERAAFRSLGLCPWFFMAGQQAAQTKPDSSTLTQPKRALSLGMAAVAMFAAASTRTSAADLSVCGTTDPSKLWAMARQIDDLVKSPALDAATSFSRDGWLRIADRLSAQSPDALRSASQGTTILTQALLVGPDRDRYCQQLGALGTSSNSLDVPVELLQARAVAAAIAPYLPDVAGSAAQSPDPDKARSMVLRAVRQVVSDDRLAAEIDLFAQALASGGLGMSQPTDWPANEVWPPSAERLQGLSAGLRHAPAQDVKICSAADPAKVSAKDIAAKRLLAEIITRNVEAWAKGCASLLTVAQPAPKPPMAVAPFVVPPPAGPAGSGRGQLLLIPFPDNPSQYSAVIKAKVGDASVQWPLGITIKDVSVGPDGSLSFLSSAMFPSVPTIDVSALTPTLRKLGLPDVIAIASANVIDADPKLQNMGLSLSVSVGDFYTGTVSLELMKDGRASELDSQLKATVGTITKAVKDQIVKTPPTLQFGASHASVSVSAVDVDLDRGSAIIDADLQLSLAGANSAAFGLTSIAASVKLMLPLDGSQPPKLLKSTWPSDVLEQTKRKLLSFIPSVGGAVGASQCIGLTGLWLSLGNDLKLALTAEITQDGETAKQIALDAADPLTDLTTHLTMLLKEPVIQQCIARQILALTNAAAADALKDLTKRTVTIVGEVFALRDAQVSNNQGKLQFRANLVWTSDESLRVNGITIDGTWKAGEALPLASIGVEGVSLPGDFVTRLLQKINPTIASWLSIRQIAFAKGNLTLTGSLALPAISSPIDLNNLTLDLSQTKAFITGIFQQAALEAVDKQAASFEDQLASLGHVKSISLDKAATTLTPTLDLVFRVIAEPVSNVTLPFLVHLPTLRVESDGTLKDTMISGAIGLLTNAMGNLNLSDSGVENLRPLIDNKLHRYGVSFDAGVNLADVIAVKLRDVVLDRNGLSLPDSFSVAFDEYIPIPPYLAIGKVGGTVWVNPPGKFGVAATLILSIDPEGWIIQVVAGFIGNGPQRTIQVDGNLLIFTIPLFHAKGFADFGNEFLTMDAETLAPLSSILAMKTTSKIDAKAKLITATSDVDLLGLKTTGALEVHLSNDKLVRVTGAANWNTLGVGADLSVLTTTEFHNPTAAGHADLGFIGARAEFAIDLRRVKLGFKWLGIGLTVIAPSVNRIDQRLIEDLIASLFDFKFSFDQLKNMNIVVNLVDKNGKKTDGSYGEGDAPGGDGGEGKEVPSPAEPTRGSTDGTATNPQPASDPCSPLNGAANRIWTKEPQLAGDNVEGTAPPGAGKIFISSNARIISDSMRSVLANSVLLACVDRPNSPNKAFHFRFTNGQYSEILNKQIAVLAPRTGPKQILALEFAKGSTAIPIALPTGAETAIFGDGGLAAAATWKSTRSGRLLLKKIVLTQLEAAARITAIHSIHETKIIPEWQPKPVSIIEVTRGAEEFIELSSDASDDDSVVLPKASPLFALLKAAPTGVLAQLVAGLQPLHQLGGASPPVIVHATGDPACLLVLVDADDTAHYAVAVAGERFSVARFTDPTSWSQSAGGWLDPYCTQLLSFGSHADVRITRERTVGKEDQALLAGRSTGGNDDPKATIWWLSTAVRPTPEPPSSAPKPATAGNSACVSEVGMTSKFPTNSVALRDPRDASVLKWKDDLGARIGMLAALSGEWNDHFTLNPRGLFLAPDGSQACPTRPIQ